MAHIFCTDHRLHVTSWEQELTELTGKNPSEVLGKKYYDVLPRIFSGDRDALSVALETNKTVTLKRYVFPCLFSQVIADLRISPVKAAGTAKGVKVMFSDLAPCSFARSLRNSQKFIDIGRTASTLAHGVRNPLNAIKGAVVYLSEKYAHESALVEFAKIMNEEISRLDNFISRFLSISISDAGFTETDINSLLKRMEVFTSLQARASNVRLVCEFGDIPRIKVNTFQLEQALLNVMNNAMDAMRSGGEMTVKTRTETLSGKEFVVIEISDTGSGIAKKNFENQSARGENKGKGFGLFIAREILQYHGGHLEIESKKGRGTSVRLCLPTVREESTIRGPS